MTGPGAKTEAEAVYHDPALASLYDAQSGDRQDFAFCRTAAEGARTILDLGCGTGALAAELAQSAQVTGVDPAQPMLDIARARPGGARVTWIRGDARTLVLDQHFDLILMTGHAFQALLTDDDQSAALSVMKRHLAPRGRILFDSRNPVVLDQPNWNRTNTRRFDHPVYGPIEKTTTHQRDDEILAYTDCFHMLVTGEIRQTTTRLRFRPKPALDAALRHAGLSPERVYGTWQGTDWLADAPEIVYHGGHAPPR